MERIIRVRKFERFSVLLVLVASPWWLPSVSASFGASFRSGITERFKPLLQGVEDLRMDSWSILAGFLQGPALLWENKRLKQKLTAALAHEEIHQMLAQENDRLRALLAFKSRTPGQAISAQVIGRDFSLWSRGLLLSKGSRQGVRSGLAVVTSLGLAGRVTDVGPTTSRMMLLTDPHFRASAVLTSSRTAGLVMGTASGDCLLTYLPLEKTFQPGESVATSGGTSFAPAGIPIGKVASSWEDASKLYRSARLVPSVQGAALEEVLVVAWNPSDSP